MASSSRLTTSLAGQRRPRPHSYTPQACERCRSRKQVCRNCIESKSICVFSRPQEKSKRSRGSSLTSPDSHDSHTPDTFDGSTMNASHMEIPQAIPVPSQRYTQEPPTFQSFSPTFMFPGSGTSTPAEQPAYPFSAPSLSRSIPPPVQQPDFDWQSWLSTMGTQYRSNLISHQNMQQNQPQQTPLMQTPVAFRSPGQMPPPLDLLNTLGQPHPHIAQSGQDVSERQRHNSSMNRPETGSIQETMSPAVPTKAPSRSAVSPGSGVTSDDDSMEEAAKGLAMISLEASAEPHYIGESAGSLWTSVIGRGMSTHPHSPVDGNKKHTARLDGGFAVPVSTSIEEALDKALHRSIQQPLTLEIATTVLETVYRHIHPRYPFMDWVAFEKQWARRDRILVGVGQKTRMDRDSSVAAFFILMILAVGSQLCKERSLPGLLRPEEYYTLAQPYLNTIVTLHNLANIQGFLLLAMYSLRDSKGPSVWYLSGVSLRL
ncbi:hypothetical protein IAU59_001104 [Kwoniella sp. CBS 9459]